MPRYSQVSAPYCFIAVSIKGEEGKIGSQMLGVALPEPHRPNEGLHRRKRDLMHSGKGSN